MQQLIHSELPANIGAPVRPAVRQAQLHGLLAVLMFSMTAPLTKLALVSFSPELVTASRGLIAGVFALWVVMANGWARPSWGDIGWLLLAGFGVVLAFPYLLALSLGRVSAGSMGVVLAGLPLVTSVLALLLMGERYRLGFWVFALLGAGVLMIYFQWGPVAVKGTGLSAGDAGLSGMGVLACATLLAGGLGYAAGARVARSLGGWAAICWMLVLYLPVTALAFGTSLGVMLQQPEDVERLAQTSGTQLMAVLYLALVSQWYGFRFWYGAMSVAGAGPISQLQLLQPLFTLVFAALFLAEALSAVQCAYALIIVVAVAGAQRFR